MEKWEFILQRNSKERELIERLTITYPLVIRDLMDIQNDNSQLGSHVHGRGGRLIYISRSTSRSGEFVALVRKNGEFYLTRGKLNSENTHHSDHRCEMGWSVGGTPPQQTSVLWDECERG